MPGPQTPGIQEGQGSSECWKDPLSMSGHLIRVLPAGVGSTPHPRALICGLSSCGGSWLESGAQPRSPGFLEASVEPWTAPSLTPDGVLLLFNLGLIVSLCCSGDFAPSEGIWQ